MAHLILPANTRQAQEIEETLADRRAERMAGIDPELCPDRPIADMRGWFRAVTDAEDTEPSDS